MLSDPVKTHAIGCNTIVERYFGTCQQTCCWSKLLPLLGAAILQIKKQYGNRRHIVAHVLSVKTLDAAKHSARIN